MKILKLKKFFQNIINKYEGLNYINAEIINNKITITCFSCAQKIIVPLLQNKKLRVTCPKCSGKFIFDCNKYKRKQKYKIWAKFALPLFIIVAIIILPIYLSNFKKNSFINVRNAYAEEVEKIQNDFTDEKANLKNNYDNEVVKLNVEELGKNAKTHYDKIWQERNNLDSKYAITPREKAQLEMLALSNDRTKKIEDIIRILAAKAAPRNSTVNVYTSSNGYNLDIDFDMSEISSGEDGTRTKHNTIESLKQDVIRLVSKVTNDVYQFSQNLDLESMAIGLRHIVKQNDANYGTSLGEENIVLYKIRLDKKDLGELKNNPFLDIYSTTKYFKIEVDNFPNLKLEITQL